MTLDKRKQKIVSIVIGAVLAVVLIYIGVRIVQKRSTQASQPVSLQAVRQPGAGDECKVTFQSASCDKSIIQYGTDASGNLPFFDNEEQEPRIAAGGLCDHEFIVEGLSPSSTYTFAQVDHPEVKASCVPVAGAQAATAPTAAVTPSLTPALIESESESAASTPIPTTSVEAVGSDEDEDVTTDAVQALTIQMALTYFTANTSSTAVACVNNTAFASYRGRAYACSIAWNEINSSGSE